LKKEVKILFVDDHAIILKGVVSMLKEITNYDFTIVTKLNCDDAYDAIQIASKTTPFDIVFSDLSFSQTNSKITSGEALIRILNQELPDLKKGIMTFRN
jgi:DNA-binding NarL/FixJ family response regulator